MTTDVPMLTSSDPLTQAACDIAMKAAAALRWRGPHYSPDQTKRIYQLGGLLIPGLRLQDCQEAAYLWMAVQQGYATAEEFEEFKNRMHAEGRVRE